MLTKEWTQLCDKRARELLSELEKKFQNSDASEIEKNGSYEEKTAYLKFLTIKKFYEDHAEEIPYIINNIESAVSVTKNEKDFYVPGLWVIYLSRNISLFWVSLQSHIFSLHILTGTDPSWN